MLKEGAHSKDQILDPNVQQRIVLDTQNRDFEKFTRSRNDIALNIRKDWQCLAGEH